MPCFAQCTIVASEGTLARHAWRRGRFGFVVEPKEEPSLGEGGAAPAGAAPELLGEEEEPAATRSEG
jgi:hypothetical protein